jgi:hypothetical protein
MKLREKGLLNDYMRGKNLNFNGLKSRAYLNDIEPAGQSLQFMKSNFEFIQAEIDRILYSVPRFDQWIPIITNIPEGASEYSYRIVNSYGEGKFISNSGIEAGNAGISVGKVPYGIEYAGILPKWTLQDVRQAAFAGIALNTATLEAAANGCISHIEKVALYGDAAYKFTGLINNADITTDAAPKTIADMSSDEIVDFIQQTISSLVEDSNEIVGTRIRNGLTIALPYSQYNRVLLTKYNVNADKTIWAYIEENNLWSDITGEKPKFKVIAELKGAGAGATDRMFVYFNNTQVMEMAMPISPRVINIEQIHYEFFAPMEYSMSGVNVKRANINRYIDGV